MLPQVVQVVQVPQVVSSGAGGAGSSGRKINLGGDKWVTVRVKNRNPNQPQVIVTGKIGDNAADTLSAIGS